MGHSRKRLGKTTVAVAVLLLLGKGGTLRGQHLDENLFKGMKWRLIGPFRGGRALAVTGVPREPNIYYFGAVSGGVWKTTNGGLTWTPLFDHEAVSSIGAIAVAPSDPNVLYVGTGEACIRGNISHGDGVYKSTDGGKTWKHVGLKDTQTIAKVIVNPHSPDMVFVAAFGHAFGPNPERGIFRSTDGGQTWERSSTRTRTRERLISASTRVTLTCSSRLSGRHAAPLTICQVAARGAGSINPSTMGRPGIGWKATGCPRES